MSQGRQNINSVFADQRQRGFRNLRFNDFVEEDFRQYYAEASFEKARPILILAIAAILITICVSMLNRNVSFIMAAFGLVIMTPLLMATIYTSFLPGRHHLYQFLLALSALLIGLVCSSITTRASMEGMPYYFGAEIGWIFAVWLILGLLFRHAAATALTISGIYIWGTFNWNFGAEEIVFEALTLLVVNAIGAYCCYQLEYTVRTSFLESRFLSQLAERDGLTGLYNRRSYDQYIGRIWRQSRREQTQLTLLLIDIDHFKAYNDLYGHQAGDDALKKVAEVIGLTAQRPLDFAARYGGEEFSLVLYGPATDYGHELPEQLRQAVKDLHISHEDSSASDYLTVSIGVAIVMPGHERSLAGAIQMADEALYQAKEDGRDRVVVKESPHTHIQTGRFRAANKLPA